MLQQPPPEYIDSNTIAPAGYEQPAPYVPPHTEDFLRFWVNPETELGKFRLHLEGKEIVKDDEGNKKTKDMCKPLMNQAGIHFVMMSLSAVVNKNTIGSNLDEARMYKLSKSNCVEFETELMKGTVSGNKYGIQKENYAIICEAYQMFVEMALRRAIGAGERGFLATNQTQHTNTTRIVDGGGGSSWNPMNLFKR